MVLNGNDQNDKTGKKSPIKLLKDVAGYLIGVKMFANPHTHTHAHKKSNKNQVKIRLNLSK